MKQAQYTKSLTVSIPPEHFEQIKNITDERCISIAEFCREALAAALITNQQKEDMTNDK